VTVDNPSKYFPRTAFIVSCFFRTLENSAWQLPIVGRNKLSVIDQRSEVAGVGIRPGLRWKFNWIVEIPLAVLNMKEWDTPDPTLRMLYLVLAGVVSLLSATRARAVT